MRPGRVVVWVLVAVAVGFAVWFVKATNDEGDRLAGPSGGTSSVPAYGVLPGTVTAAPSPSVLVSDVAAFDLTGSGDACRMHYAQVNGKTVTTFNLTANGEMITHVSGPDGVVRNDRQLAAGVSAFTYGFPLGDATDMGAVLYLPDGSSQSCTISAGAGAP